MPLLGEAISIAIIGFGFSVFEPNDHLDNGDFDDSDMDLSSDDSSDEFMDDDKSDMSGPSYRLLPFQLRAPRFRLIRLKDHLALFYAFQSEIVK